MSKTRRLISTGMEDWREKTDMVVPDGSQVCDKTRKAKRKQWLGTAEINYTNTLTSNLKTRGTERANRKNQPN